MLVGVILLLAAFLVVEFAVRPVLAARSAALASIERSERMRSGDAQVPVRQDGGAAGAPVSAVVTRTAAARGLAIRRLEPAGAGARLSVENADFGDLVRWIAEIEMGQGLRVVAVEMARSTGPGIVNAVMTVRR